MRDVELPEHLTHYFRDAPFRSLTDLEPDDAAEVIGVLELARELPFRLKHPSYLPRRREIEAEMRCGDPTQALPSPGLSTGFPESLPANDLTRSSIPTSRRSSGASPQRSASSRGGPRPDQPAPGLPFC